MLLNTQTKEKSILKPLR